MELRRAFRRAAAIALVLALASAAPTLARAGQAVAIVPLGVV
jgi:hypothetical protein